MFKGYFRIAWRNLIRYKGLSMLNIGGLAIGIASSIVLLSYVSFQSGYDSFNAGIKDIYRIDLSLYENSKLVFQSAENYPALAPTLKKELPEVVNAARLYNMGYKNNCVFTYNNNSFRETKFLYADASFLRIFTYPLLKGDPSMALAEPFSAIISSSLAKKMFGMEDPIGKSIKMDDDDRNAELCKITGVFEDVPYNSHLQFNILISYATLYRRGGGIRRFEAGWDRKDFYTYVQLRPGTDPTKVESKLAGIIGKYIPDERANHRLSVFNLQPLNRIHLNSGYADEPETTINPSGIAFLITIAFFILTIGWINYVNMNTASSASRGKEIGVRKVLGSRKADLIRQFMTESFALNLISLAAAILLVMFARPLLEQQFHLHIEMLTFLNSSLGKIFLASMCLGSILSGLYPAFFLSSLKPVSVLKGKLTAQPAGLALRKSLLVFQFALSIVLIIGTVIVYQQVHFMLNKDLGMNISQVVVLDRPGKWDTARTQHNHYVQRFRETLSKSPFVVSVGMSDELPGKEIRNPGLYKLRDAKDQAFFPVDAISVDEDFLVALQFTFLAGRNFSRQSKTDRNGLVMTRSAARTFGLNTPQEAVGKQVLSDGTSYTILGIVDDFHQMSLDKAAQPIVFQLNNSDLREFEYYLIKIKPGNTSAAVQQIQALWNDTFRNNPFNFRFLDDDFNRQYSSVIRFQTFFASFAIVAVIISCIGLFSLLALMILQRTREIGIRKILGASVQQIVLLLSKEFLQLILLANLLAWPLGWLLMNGWLKDFPYRIHPHFSLFLLSGSATVLIALLTIGVQSLRAAIANPVKTLKTE